MKMQNEWLTNENANEYFCFDFSPHTEKSKQKYSFVIVDIFKVKLVK